MTKLTFGSKQALRILSADKQWEIDSKETNALEAAEARIEILEDEIANWEYDIRIAQEELRKLRETA